MKFYFENLSIGVIVFYFVVAILFCGVWTLVLRSIMKMVFKREINAKRVFIILTALMFMLFMIATLLDKPYESLR